MEGKQSKTRGKPAAPTKHDLIVEAWDRLGRTAIGEAELRHPEVIEFDARWREAKIESECGEFKGLEDLVTGKPLPLKKAAALIKKLEKLRKSSESSGDLTTSKQARNRAVNGRQIAESLAKDRMLNQTQRAEQAEIAEGLRVWIQTPNLFEDWLDLRRRSPDFQKKFSS